MTETQRHPTSRVSHALETLSNLAIGIAAIALLGLVVVQGWQVFARYVLNDSPSWTEPVTLLLLATAMAMGAAAGVHTGRHFGFYLARDHFRPAAKRWVDALVSLVIAAIGGVLAGWGAILLRDGWAIKAAGADLPQNINYLPLAVGGALMVLFALGNLWAAINGGRQQPAAPPQEETA